MAKKHSLRSLLAIGLLLTSACGAPSLMGQSYSSSLSTFARAQAVDEYGMGAEIVPEEPDVVGDGPMTVQAALPPVADLRPNMPPVYSQAGFGSCTAFATVKGLREYLALREGRGTELSARYFWYAARSFYDQKKKLPVPAAGMNSGVPTGLAIQTIKTFGTVPERAFAYPSLAEFTSLKDLAKDERKAALDQWAAVAPPRDLRDDAKKWRIHESFYTVGSVHGLRKALSEGRPVVIAARLYESFKTDEAKKTGRIPVPQPAREKELGGHAMLAVGYDNTRQVIIVRNSWGKTWGDGGYCYMPYGYFRQMGRDGRSLVKGGWTIR